MGAPVGGERSRQGSSFHFHVTVQPGADEAPAWLVAPLALRGKRICWSRTIRQHRALAQSLALGIDLGGGERGPAEARLEGPSSYDLLLLDYDLLGATAAQAVASLRTLRGATNAAVLLFTDRRLRSGEAEALGVMGFISKPVRPAQLLEGLARALTGAHQEKRSPVASRFDESFAERLPLHLLVADDNAVSQKVALMMLKRLGYRADAVANGVEVLRALEGKAYDVVFLDGQMPEGDGYEASRASGRLAARVDRPSIVRDGQCDAGDPTVSPGGHGRLHSKPCAWDCGLALERGASGGPA